jgi:hypothetical protein|tara:strand:+ start:604 stop:1557 length:954 start_codon:yes stop_codon:yes gene_type:complete
MHYPPIKIKVDRNDNFKRRYWYGWSDRNFFKFVNKDYDFEVISPDYDYPEKWVKYLGKKKLILDLSWEGQDKIKYPAANGFVNLYDYVDKNTLILNGNEREDIWINTTYSFVNLFKTNESSPSKEKFGICLNRRDKEHRTQVIEFLKEKNYIDDFIWSFKSNEDEYGEDSVLVDGVIDGLKQHQPTDLFSKTYFNIVTESLFEDPGFPIFLTEKTFKALYNKNLFVICGEYKGVQTLREKGFDVFDDVINHGYDEEKDIYNRMEKVLTSIEEVMESKDEIIKKYETLNDRLEYNKQLVQRLPKIHTKEVYRKLWQLK